MILKYFTKVKNYFKRVESKSELYNKLVSSYARSACGLQLQNKNSKKTLDWEFSGFSQNGEDGIIQVLIENCKENNNYFVEIGCGDGVENNTAFLAHNKKWSGLMIEGSKNEYNTLNKSKPWLVNALNEFVTLDNIELIKETFLFNHPDVFSIDIDGVDYHIVSRLMELGFLPKIIVVEYNSAFGPNSNLTIPYEAAFNMFTTDHPYLYYGVSINAWKNLLKNYGYEFITVDSNGVNAFFIQSDNFNSEFINNVEGIEFCENRHQLRLFNCNWENQFIKIKHLPLITLS
jgi:hypothetical protein